MKTAKLVIGIISMVLFVLVAFQSCAAGLGNALADNGEVSGTSGMLLAFCMLIAGIVGVATRKSKGGGIVAGVFYLLGGLLGIVNYGSFSDLVMRRHSGWRRGCRISLPGRRSRHKGA